MSDRKSLGESKTQHLEVKITIFLWTKTFFFFNMQVILEFGHTSTLRDVVDVDPGTATHDWEVGLVWMILDFSVECDNPG